MDICNNQTETVSTELLYRVSKDCRIFFDTACEDLIATLKDSGAEKFREKLEIYFPVKYAIHVTEVCKPVKNQILDVIDAENAKDDLPPYSFDTERTIEDIFLGFKTTTTAEQREKLLSEEPESTKRAGEVWETCRNGVIRKYLQIKLYLTSPKAYNLFARIACDTCRNPSESYDMWIAARYLEEYSKGERRIYKPDLPRLMRNAYRFKKMVEEISDKELEELFCDGYETDQLEYTKANGVTTFEGVEYSYEHVYA